MVSHGRGSVLPFGTFFAGTILIISMISALIVSFEGISCYKNKKKPDNINGAQVVIYVNIAFAFFLIIVSIATMYYGNKRLSVYYKDSLF